MTREEFLNTEWQKYPVFTASVAPYNENWVTGRVQEFSASQVVINGDAFELTNKKHKDTALGVSVPIGVLIAGDVVAYDGINKAVYLLSPCLQPKTEERGIPWQMFIHSVHDFFAKEGFIHWLTPSFVESAGVDANIDFFYAKGVRTGRTYRLPTSPEFELKKAMVQGVDLIYEIKNCYRDDDTTPVHKTEFTMLEWYRSFATLEDIENDVKNLLNSLFENFGLPYENIENFSRYTMADLFKTYLQFDLHPQTSLNDLKKLLEAQALDWSDTDDWNDLFFRVYVDRIEPHLKALGAIIIRGFPAQQRSLSRLTKDGWADRFEFYWNGVEIANAYHEENNPTAIEEIIANEMKKRVKAGREPIQKDSSFVEMMKQGLPPSSGIALGLERLMMCLFEKNDIGEI